MVPTTGSAEVRSLLLKVSRNKIRYVLCYDHMPFTNVREILAQGSLSHKIC